MLALGGPQPVATAAGVRVSSSPEGLPEPPVRSSSGPPVPSSSGPSVPSLPAPGNGRGAGESPPELAPQSPATSPAVSLQTCDELLQDAEARADAGYPAIAAELYVQAYRCLHADERRGPLGTSVLAASVEMYKRSVLADPRQTEMLLRATRFLEEHLAELEAHPGDIRREDRAELVQLLEELDLLRLGLQCRHFPDACSGPRRRVGPVSIGLSVSGAVALLAGGALTAVGGTALRIQRIREQDVRTVGRLLTESRRADHVEAIQSQANVSTALLGVGIGLVAVGATLLTIGLVRGRRRLARPAVQTLHRATTAIRF